MKSKYVIQPCGATTHTPCGKPMHLLCRKDGEMKTAFYICFACQYVTQVGVGEVEHES